MGMSRAADAGGPGSGSAVQPASPVGTDANKPERPGQKRPPVKAGSATSPGGHVSPVPVSQGAKRVGSNKTGSRETGGAVHFGPIEQALNVLSKAQKKAAALAENPTTVPLSEIGREALSGAAEQVNIEKLGLVSDVADVTEGGCRRSPVGYFEIECLDEREKTISTHYSERGRSEIRSAIETTHLSNIIMAIESVRAILDKVPRRNVDGPLDRRLNPPQYNEFRRILEYTANYVTAQSPNDSPLSVAEVKAKQFERFRLLLFSVRSPEVVVNGSDDLLDEVIVRCAGAIGISDESDIMQIKSIVGESGNREISKAVNDWINNMAQQLRHP